MSGVFSQSLYSPVRWVLLPSECARKRSSSKWLPQGERVNWRLLIPKLMYFFHGNVTEHTWAVLWKLGIRSV